MKIRIIPILSVAIALTSVAWSAVAISTAAASPSNEDDLAAMRLAHFGSYRFFLDGKSPSEKTPAAN